MGKRSDYELRPRDKYFTPRKAVEPLRDLIGTFTFCEPCAGDGRLVSHVEDICGALCVNAFDIEPNADWIKEFDSLDMTGADVENCQLIVTNPPFTFNILKPLMDKWLSLRPTLLLLPADFIHNKRMKVYMDQCVWIKSIGRVKWIEDSKVSGVDNFIWAMFEGGYKGPTRFIGRDL